MNQKKLPGKFHIVESLKIRATVTDVWGVIADFSAVDTWAPQVTKSYALGTRDRDVGAKRHCDIKGFGGIDEVVIEWIEGRGLTYRVTPLGPLGVSYNRWTVEELNETSSEVTVELSYDVRFGVIGKLLHKVMMRRKLEQAFLQGLKALKTRVETGKLVRPRRSVPGIPQLIIKAA